MGSGIGNAVATANPKSIDAMVLTGYSGSAAASDLVLAIDPIPAASFSPRFAGLSSGYLVTLTNFGRQRVLYGRNGTYDPRIADLDFSTQDTVAIGELATSSATVAVDYTGPVAVITGEDDAVACFVDSTVWGHCGQGDASKQAQVRYQFPNTSAFS
ncbi:hypothetical protein BDV23DRAFT_185625 [Aspergillus alliaceus]|uniref:Uncharacterized protein n=1 Tax=Petromyces alliaceus TaxID=209559 RepID=A0A5N7C219_PETAA|nr:hypothetical protein BDV23DRAFT_185625 [Aspergillus alliaceus]